MNIDITGRQIEVTPALRDFAEDKLRKLTKLLDEPLDIHIVLAIEKHRHMAEIQVKSRSGIFSSMHETRRPVRLDRRGGGQTRTTGAQTQREASRSQAPQRPSDTGDGGRDRGQ